LGDSVLLNVLAKWVPELDLRARIMVRNQQTLCGFK